MKTKKIIIAIVAILVVLGGTFAGLWFFTDVFNFLKPANNVFSDQIEKAFNLENAKFSNYSDFLKEYKEMSNKPVSSKIDLTAELNISSLDSDIQKTINKSKLTIESNSDIANNKAQNKIGLYSGNSEVLTLDMVKNDSTIGIGSKDLYDKYLTATMEDFIKYLGEEEDLDSDEIEQLLNSSMSNLDPYELLYISEDDLKHFDDTYRDCLKTLISKDCYSSEKNVKVDVDDDEVKTTAYYLTLTGEDAYKFADDLLNLIKNDDTISKIIAEKANLLLQSTTQDKIDEDEIKDMISELTDSILDEFEVLKDETDSAIQIAVYSDKSNPVKIELNLLEDVKDFDEKETLLTIEYAKNKTIYKILNDDTEIMRLVNEFSKNTDEEKVGKLELTASGQSVGTLDYEIVLKDDSSKVDLSLNIPLAKVSADISLSTTGNYKKEEVAIEGTIGFKYGNESANIKYNGTVKYGEASIPELTSTNSVDLFDLSEKEMQNLGTEILTKASEVLPSRLKLIGINITKDDILPPTLNSNNTENTDENTATDVDSNADTNTDANNNVA